MNLRRRRRTASRKCPKNRLIITSRVVAAKMMRTATKKGKRVNKRRTLMLTTKVTKNLMTAKQLFHPKIRRLCRMLQPLIALEAKMAVAKVINPKRSKKRTGKTRSSEKNSSA